MSWTGKTVASSQERARMHRSLPGARSILGSVRGIGNHLGVHDQPLRRGTNEIKRVTGNQRQRRLWRILQNLDGAWKHHAQRNHSIFERARRGRQSNLVSQFDFSQGTKVSISMACKSNVAGAARESRARYVPNRQPQRASIGTFEHPCRKTHHGNLDRSDRSYSAWPIYARGARLLRGACRTASRE